MPLFPFLCLIATRISDCDISTWMSTHHLKLNVNNTELRFLPGKDCPHMDLLVTVEDAVVGPLTTARNLGVILDDQLRCTANITAVTQSCRFALYNPSSQGKQHSSWSKHSSHPTSTTETHSWLGSLPPRSSLCSASRPRQHDSCSTCRSSPT